MKQIRNFRLWIKAYFFWFCQILGLTICYPKKGLDNHQFNARYTRANYLYLNSDRVRTGAYRQVVSRCVRGKKVLEVGTGDSALLPFYCAKAGAKHIFSIEENPDSYARACCQVGRSRYKDVIELVCGYSSDVEPPGRYDIFLHEIIGAIGSEEGVSIVTEDVKKRFLVDQPTFVPERCVTWMAPIEAVPFGLFTRLFAEWVMGERLCGHDEYYLYNPPRRCLLAQPQIFEDLVFSEDLRFEEDQELSFPVVREGLLEGVLFSIELFVDRDTRIDSLSSKTSWPTVFKKLSGTPWAVRGGDVIHLHTRRDVSTAQPRYEIELKTITST